MSAFSIPLSGLAATSESLNVIANNLANLNTDGFKDQSLSFGDVFNQVQGISGNGDPIQVGSGVQVDGSVSNFTDGSVTSTGISSNMALQGNGFFVVEGSNGQMTYTRAGNFEVNDQGQLATPGGQLVMGYPAVNGVVSSSSALAPIDVTQAANIPASPTSSFDMTTNLDSSAAVGDTFSTPITVYDSLGASHVLTVQYTNTGANSWSYNINIPAADTGGTGTATTVATGNLTFDSSGNLTSPTGSVTGINITGLADGAAPMNLTWNVADSAGNSTITQQDATSATSATGLRTATAWARSPAIRFCRMGRCRASSATTRLWLWGRWRWRTLPTRRGSQQVGGNGFQATFASGAAVIGTAGAGGNGTITGSAVEASNVSLSTEFANMIVAQQGYEANAKALSTMDQVSQATIQLIS